MPSPAERTAKHEASHALRTANGEFLGNHSAHRDSHDVGRIDARRIEDCFGIGSHRCEAKGPNRHIALAYPAVVQKDCARVPRKKRAEFSPHREREAQAHDEKQRFSRAVILPVDTHAAVLCVRHNFKPTVSVFPPSPWPPSFSEPSSPWA